MDDSKRDAAVMLEAGAAIARARLAEGHYAVVPERYQLEDLERFAAHARRMRGDFTALRWNDFVNYIQRFDAFRAERLIMLDTEHLIFRAVLDHSEVTQLAEGDATPHLSAGHGQHCASYRPRCSLEFSPWARYDGVKMDQGEFALLIEDNLPAIVEPAAADMLTVATSFEATLEVKFESSKRLDNGAIALRYVEDTRPGSLAVPREFKLLVPLFEDSEPEEVRARLRYRINDKRELVIWFNLIDVAKLRRARLLSIMQLMEAALGQTVLEGSWLPRGADGSSAG